MEKQPQEQQPQIEPSLPDIFQELENRWRNGEISYTEAIDIYTKIAYELAVAKAEEKD